VIAVGQGKTKHARNIGGRLAPSVNCLVREDDSLHRTYGLEELTVIEGLLQSPGLMTAGMRAVSRGHVQGQTTGNIRMLPGTFVVNQEGVIQVAHYNKHAGDHPDISGILKAIL